MKYYDKWMADEQGSPQYGEWLEDELAESQKREAELFADNAMAGIKMVAEYVKLQEENARLREALDVADKALESSVSALNWLPPDAGPVRRRGGEVVREIRDARLNIATLAAKEKP